MIHEEQGRSWSEQTVDDLEELVAAEFHKLSPGEKELVLQMYAEALGEDLEHEGRRVVDQIATAQYIREPVDMRTFILDPYYLGETCNVIFPQLLDDLIEVFDGQYSEVIFTGAIGTGKTFSCSIGICRMLYELSCLHQPQRAYGLSKEAPISIACFSANEELAKEVALKNVVGKIAQSPYFAEHFPFKITQKNIRFPNNVLVVSRATTPRGALGMNLIAGLIDEGNFLPVRKKKANDRFGAVNMAKDLYDSIKRRIHSRYGRAGKLFLPSSKATHDSFIQQRIEAAKYDSTIFVRDYALWDVKPDDYGPRRFYVLCGNEQVRSRILGEDEAVLIKENQPERTVLIEVPEDLRSEFTSDLEGSIRDLAGIATTAVSPFIQRRDKIHDMVDATREHPFTSEVFDPSLGGDFLWEKLVRAIAVRTGFKETEQKLIPLLNPSAQRHVHIDPALNNCSAGLCMAHIGGQVPVRRMDSSLRVYEELAPQYVIDLILEIVPPPGGDLDFALYRQLVYDLKAHGFPIVHVTMDQWQSIDSLQTLSKKGFTTDQVSMDRTWDPYQTLKQALYEDRVSCYAYNPVLNQLQSLEADWEKRKVLKPRNGAKDVSDAMAGALYSLKTVRNVSPTPFLMGLSTYDDPDSQAWMVEQQHAVAAGHRDALNSMGLSVDTAREWGSMPFLVG